MQSLKLTIAYMGANYVGWQVQPNGRSVQALLERAWTQVTQEKVRITASGRTDSGVHALAQVCSVQTETRLEPEILRRALNANIPEDIEVLLIERARDGFHAIRHAVQKTYRYQINWGHPRDVFQIGRSWYIPQRLDIDAMAEAAKLLEGEKDFKSFEAKKASTVTSIRDVSQLTVVRKNEGVFKNVWVEATANGFLYNMVRNIVGTLVEVGYGHQEPAWVEQVLAQRDRQHAGMTAPAWGLYLVEVRYDS